MNYSFKLRDPKSNNPTPIYFTVYFKEEKKSLIYSTEKKIHPSDWDPYNHIAKGKDLVYHTSIQTSKIRSRCVDIVSHFDKIEAIYDRLGEKLTSSKLKEELDIKLERSMLGSKGFFDVYEEFIEFKRTDFSKRSISESTVTRYKSYRNLLEEYENHIRSKITFNSINLKFYNDLLKFSIEVKKQSANTLYRNIGLFKTFMHWAYDNQKTRNNEFLKFEKPSKQNTNEIALNIEQVTEIFNYDLSSNPKLERVRDVFLIGCLTGQRFSNYTQFKRSDIVMSNNDEILLVPDCKDVTKILSIPCLEVTKKILMKYDYDLPIISNQKFNEYLKEVFQLIGYDDNTKKIKRIGNKIHEVSAPLYSRISSHVARRTFITIMLNKNVPIKIIMSITGHKSLENFMLYYIADDTQKIAGMKEAFKSLTL